MTKSSFTKFFVERDVFGQPINVLYKGSETYKTKLGALFTFITLMLTLINAYSLVVGFFDGSQQKESSAT